MKPQIIIHILIYFVFIFVSCGEKCIAPPILNAGNDTIIYNDNSLTLNCISDSKTGSWEIYSGAGGLLEDATSPDTKFSGSLNTEYTLIWTSTNDCGVSSDTLKVNFLSKLTVNQMTDSIGWIQQSCFRLKGTGVTVYIDPQAIKAGMPIADVIFISHSHGDHFSTGDIKKIANENTLIYGPADCKYNGTCKEFITVKPDDLKSVLPNLWFKAVPAYNNYHSKTSNWVGYVINLDGVTVYHTGDTKRIDEMKSIDCDIALMPLGQTYTMSSVQEAVDAVKDCKAEIAIPMHYGSAEGKASDAELFKTLLAGFAEVVIKTKE